MIFGVEAVLQLKRKAFSKISTSLFNEISPKGMLQIYLNEQIPTEILREIFSKILN